MSSQRQDIMEDANQRILSNKLWLYILIGMALGIAAGLALSQDGFNLISETTRNILSPWIALPGVIFIGILKMVIVPLVLCSIILGIATSGSLEHLKQMGLRLIPYFILTTAIAITIGISMASLIKPGDAISEEFKASVTQSESPQSTPKTLENLTIPDRIANIIPSNPQQAKLDRNMLQIIVMAIFIGVCVIVLPAQKTQSFREICEFGQMACMTIISWAMMIAPIAVFGLLCDITMKIGFDAIQSTALYVATVIGGLLTMGIVYLLIAYFITGRAPLTMLRDIREPQILAFSTSSSAAVMPISIQAAEEKLRVKPEVSRFVVPLGATVNMDGTALYQSAAAIFLCQVFGIDLTLGETVLLLVTTVGASIGTPAMPGVGIVVLATILAGIGVPLAGIGLILGVDRILDMCRTTINVTGDLTACCVMDRFMRDKANTKEKD
jgi:Na+/H+-dicarboxylate symporter